MSKNEYLFNTNRIILKMYEQGTPMSKEMFSLLNLDEECENTVMYEIEGRAQHLKNEATIIENMIEYLPFEAYKGIIDESFINKRTKKDGNLISKAMNHKQFEYVQCLLNFGDGILKDIDPKEFYNERTLHYYQNVLEPILNLNYIDSWSYGYEHHSIAQYQEVFYCALKQHEQFSKSFASIYGVKNNNYKKWFVNHEKMFRNFRYHIDIEHVIKNLLENEFYMPVLQDVYSQYKGIENPFQGLASFQRALLNNNIDFIQFIQKKEPTHYDMDELIHLYLKHTLHKFHQDAHSKGYQDNRMFNGVCKTLSFLKENYPDNFAKVEHQAPLGLLRFSAEQVEKLETFFPLLRSAPAFDGQNYYEMIQIGREISHLRQTHDFRTQYNHEGNMVDIFNHLYKYNPDTPTVLNSSIYDFIDAHKNTLFDLRNDDETKLTATRLDRLLGAQSGAQKKRKI